MSSDPSLDSSNAGKRWSKVVVAQLLHELENKTPLEEISKIHKRNIGGIESRIAQLASDYIDAGVSIVDVSRKFNIDVLELEKKIKQLRRRDKPKNDDNVSINDIHLLLIDIMAELSDIKDSVQKLEKKLEKIEFEDALR